MAAYRPRIKVTFAPAIYDILTDLANHENKSVACLVQELTLECLDMREDRYLSGLAERRDQAGSITYSPEEAWN